MPDYVYDFGNGYKVQTVFANKLENGVYGDIYDFKSDVLKEHPGAEILTGYCVIDTASGLVPFCCNDWNESIPEALKDYDEHLLPFLEKREDIELEFDEVDQDGVSIGKTVFTVKSDWLMDYFDLDNKTQLEAMLLNSDSWNLEEILENARKDEESGLILLEEPSIPEPEGLKPYLVKITETSVRHVVVYASDELDAESLTDDLWRDEKIVLDYDDFVDKTTECQRIATSADIELQEVFGKPKKAVQIEWDVDNKEELKDLPDEIDIPRSMEDEEEISDYLSNVTGYCHKGYTLIDKEPAAEKYKKPRLDEKIAQTKNGHEKTRDKRNQEEKHKKLYPPKAGENNHERQ